MAKAASCKCKKSECEECPEWIFTFADLVMLMMGFFVILWVLKPSPSPKVGNGDPGGTPTAAAIDQHWIDTVAAIREAFDYKAKPGSTDPIDVAVRAKRDNLTPAGPKDQGRAAVAPQTPAGIDAEPSAIRPGQQSVTGGRLAFASGASVLTPQMLSQIDQVAEQVRGHRNLVLVQGHTGLDDLDEGASASAKLALSLRRAEAVADRLTADGVSPDVLRVVGCSTFEPVVAGRYTPGVQADNRRVEVLVSPQLADDVQATRPAAK